ncbi:hypothetical protein [Streptomyces sp. NBC_01304]|uniref:hypothetical protein n=1 Tax=Streptomyces sp. NBC_01304 TaxID=2903818 RepID=UPI002E0E9DA8|nr:hypothetical protein OG430_36355 [Streptomyces sp. NBC_01304]
MTMEALTSIARHRRGIPLPLPDGMKEPLGRDAVGMPQAYGDRVLARLPRVGCVFADGARWWWIVPAGSGLWLDWPEPVRYVADAVVTGAPAPPRLIVRPADDTPYTPPIPLYLTLCGLTDTVPSWMRDTVA